MFGVSQAPVTAAASTAVVTHTSMPTPTIIIRTDAAQQQHNQEIIPPVAQSTPASHHRQYGVNKQRHVVMVREAARTIVTGTAFAKQSQRPAYRRYRVIYLTEATEPSTYHVSNARRSVPQSPAYYRIAPSSPNTIRQLHRRSPPYQYYQRGRHQKWLKQKKQKRSEDRRQLAPNTCYRAWLGSMSPQGQSLRCSHRLPSRNCSAFIIRGNFILQAEYCSMLLMAFTNRYNAWHNVRIMPTVTEGTSIIIGKQIEQTTTSRDPS